MKGTGMGLSVLRGLPYEVRRSVLSSLQTNVASLQVFFQELNYQAITESPAFTLVDLLVNFGPSSSIFQSVTFGCLSHIIPISLVMIFPQRHQIPMRVEKWTIRG